MSWGGKHGRGAAALCVGTEGESMIGKGLSMRVPWGASLGGQCPLGGQQCGQQRCACPVCAHCPSLSWMQAPSPGDVTLAQLHMRRHV